MLRLYVALVIALVGCVGVARVPPEVRSEQARMRSAVQVDIACRKWAARSGTGVIVSERHVLTAAHVVDCPAIPTVYVTYFDGVETKRVRMVVTHADDDADVARLELADARRFELGISPPVLRAPAPGDDVCANLVLADRPPRTCGIVAGEWTVARSMRTRAGDSGAPVYGGAGELVGLVIASGSSSFGRPYTRVAPIDPRWIQDLVRRPRTVSGALAGGALVETR